MQVFISLLLVIFSLLGISDAGYLTYEKFSGIIPPCTTTFQCETVLTSKYASIGPVPLSVFGLIYYLFIFTLSVLLFVDFKFDRAPATKRTILRYTSPLELLIVFSSGGILFSAYLIFIMAVILKAWCLYCLLSAATSSLLFIFIQIYAALYAEESPYYIKLLLHTKEKIIYKYIVKPIYFLFDPELIHTIHISAGSWISQFALGRLLLRAVFTYVDPQLTITSAGISFPNPVGLSAGFDYNGDLTQAVPAIGFGWHTIGTVTLRDYAGNERPRLGRFPKSQALLVNKGLKNIGARAIIEKLKNQNFAIPTGISIASTNKYYKNVRVQIEDIIECFKLFEKSNVLHAYYELNISCPNTFGGEPFNTPERLTQLLSALDTLQIERPVFVKMPIDQSDTETLQLLKVIDKHRIAGVIFGNLTKDKSNPAVVASDRTAWKNLRGNLSGKPTFERSNRLIALTKKHYANHFVIIGTGGIFTPADAQEKIALGADLVQLISGMIFEGPQLIGSINRTLSHQKKLDLERNEKI